MNDDKKNNTGSSVMAVPNKRYAGLKPWPKGVSGNPGGKSKGIPGKVNRQRRGYIKKG